MHRDPMTCSATLDPCSFASTISGVALLHSLHRQLCRDACFVRAPAIVTLGEVAVHAETIPLGLVPPLSSCLPHNLLAVYILPSMLCPVVVYVIQREKIWMRFTTTRALILESPKKLQLQ